MLDKIIFFSIKNKLIIGMLTLGLIIWGGYSLSQLPIDAVPDITNNQVQVITTSPSLAAEEVERLITFPIEITMATIPAVEEIRSFSRFGLSVVTIVFKEDADIYWARQQVNERMAEVESQIPPGVGKPGLAPITTGLGEIYQYVVETKPGYEDKYSVQDLRTIQDWIVRRQLLGTPGVADVSSFGGYLKQYEIAIDPNKLNAMNVSIAEIFNALEANNENTGGAYIEKNKRALFIRSEGLINGLEDIRNIAVKNNPDGTPLYIRNIGEVRLGSAIRYGATTRNGNGEVVSAIVMMLKGENSAEVIKNVKNKIEEIRKTLPEGIAIVPFLDRTKLVNNAIGTVTRNLTEGALIVIFILLLLLGNFRAGLIVASIIPLALIFAFGMMKLFGVSGNLMSLGAIDFGLIVDGAVIIVEATLHHMGKLKLGRRLTQFEMDEEVFKSASKIRNSAAFGEIIILIVYLPILALVGTEGKMFRPMAQTVGFAILGAFILSLTYVPMMSALFLSKKTTYKRNISDKIMSFFHHFYNPAIRWSMHKRPLILLFTAGLFILSIWIFSLLGGEFIPTLEEGDFAVETRVMTGSSLENTINATTQAEQILLSKFPEVIQVVSKIGSGEIPTDPMPPEAADLMIILKDHKDWESATSREELANKMAEALEVIPGVTFGFQQPIQMRFNELMTGVRQDVAIKIYGDDLKKLSYYAQQIGDIASSVDGAVDLYIEEVIGIPQIVIDYKRDQLAKFGLTVREVNQTIQTAFAGVSTGLVYEGERRFDLVVRLSKTNRNDIEDVRNLYLNRKDGHQIPLYQVADVQIKEGPYQIQRDDTRRRIIVAFNVRNRDVESIVTEIQGKINESVHFDPGYAVTYGGQFENLVEARRRLSLAVPVALLLIFVLLYFTFGSIKQSILIFTAIPLSAIGGIFALYLRDMPFSISAGIGFIALFGVAVLNGIVLLSEFNRLKKEGIEDIFERIYVGTSVRLRPVIMTAAVASLGFLPMALSQSSGAEVQKPLATVVIGGLITATFLTLVVLPVFYYYFERGIKLKAGSVVSMLIVFLLFFQGTELKAQQSIVTLNSMDEAIQLAIEKNPKLNAADLQTEKTRTLKSTSWNLPKTELSFDYGQTNSIYNNDTRLSVTQRFAFPTVYSNQNKLADVQIKASEQYQAATQNELVQQVKSAWYSLMTAYEMQKLHIKQDSIYKDFVKASRLRYETGETNLLELSIAESVVADVLVMIQQNVADIAIYQTELLNLVNVSGSLHVEPQTLTERSDSFILENPDIQNNPIIGYYEQQVQIAAQEKSVTKSRLLPDITLGYFNQSFNGPGQTRAGDPVNFSSGDRFDGIQVGLAIPLFGLKSEMGKINGAELERQSRTAELNSMTNELDNKLKLHLLDYQKQKSTLEYYKANALPQADLILNQAQQSFDSGEIGFMEYTQGLNRALQVKFNYLNLLDQYNQTIIKLEYISGIQNQ